MSQRALRLSGDAAAAILKAAERAYPSECCGLIEGYQTEEGWCASRVHEAANVADEPARHFLVDPVAQFALLRATRGTEQRIIGCFHSHPDGSAEPSATDRASAMELDFLWLIAAGSPMTGFILRGFVFVETVGFTPVALEDD